MWPWVAGACVAALGLLAALLIYGGAQGKVDCDSFRFDPGRWAAGDRHGIAKGVAQCGTLDGRSKSHVERLLGKPLERAHKFWSYPTGRSDDLGDAEYLYVNFDRSGRVTSSDVSGG